MLIHESKRYSRDHFQICHIKAVRFPITYTRESTALKMPIIIIAIASTIVLASCASDVANRYYVQERYKPVAAEKVQLLWEKPNKPFTVIADFQSRGESPQDMQKKAAEIGADAVIISLLGGNYSKNEEWASKDRHSTSYSRIAATAIKFN